MGEDGRAIIDHQSQQLPNQCGSPAKGTRRRSICSARETVFWLAAEPKENPKDETDQQNKWRLLIAFNGVTVQLSCILARH